MNNTDRKSRGLLSIATTIAPIAKNLLGSKGFVEIDLISNWDKIIGSELALESLPEKIVFPKGEKNNGTLHLMVSTGAFALEITHKEKSILNRINSYFGYSAVSSLKISQNRLPPSIHNPEEKSDTSLVSPEEVAYIETLNEGVSDPLLRETLNNLGKSILKRVKK